MGKAKDILIQPISAKDANKLVKELHYSGKVVNNSQLHLGVFYHGKIEGAMQFGPSLDKRKIQGLVKDTKWHEFMELNRMAFSDRLPRNSESRALGVAFKLLRKKAPQLKWVISFADATQCGDGTIYRASGFVLPGIKENEGVAMMPDGRVVHKLDFMDMSNGGGREKKRYGYKEGEGHTRFLKRIGAMFLKGYQLRYIYFIDPTFRQKLTVPEIPYSRIDELGIGMYKGKKRVSSSDGAASGFQSEEGGSSPTGTLHISM